MEDAASPALPIQHSVPSLGLAETQALLAEALAQQQALRLENQQLHTAQQELAASETRLKAAEAVAGIGSYELDLASGTLHFSEGMYRLFGEVPPAAVAPVPLDWVDARSDPDDAAAVRQELVRAQRDKSSYYYTRRVRRADGQWRMLESHGRVVCDAAGAARRLEGVVEDKTEQRQAEQELRTTKERLQITLDSSLYVVQAFEAVRDGSGRIVDFTWIFANKTWKDQYGDPKGKSLLSENPGVVPNGLFELFVRVTETGVPVDHEHFYDKEQFDGWFHQTLVKMGDGFVMHTEDINGRKQAEQELQASRELLRATIDSSLSMVQVFEAVRNEQGEIVDFVWVLNNQVSEQRYGNVIGQRLLAQNPGVVGVGIFDTFKRVVKTGQPDQSEHHYVQEQFDGWFYQSTVKLRDGVATTTVDISERKRHEQEILQLKDAMAQQAEDKYRTLFDAIDEGFSLFELLYDEHGAAIDYRFLEVNHAFEHQTGLANAQGKLGSELAPDTEFYWLDIYAQVAQTGQPMRFENYHTSTGRWYEVYAARMGGAGSGLVCTVFSDVTERRQAAEILRESQERKSFLLQFSDELRPLADAVSIQEAVTRVGRSFFQADRCSYAEIADGQCRILHHAVSPDQPPILSVYDLASMPLFTAVVKAGQPFTVENAPTAQWLDEHLRQLCEHMQVVAFLDVPVIKNGEPVGLLSITKSTPRSWTPLEVELAQEIAERTWAAVERAKTEQALRESEERFRNLVESYAQAVWETDTDGLIRQDSPSWRAYTGQTEAEWMSKGWVSGIHPDDQAYATHQWQEAKATERNVNAEFRLRCADGSYCWTNVRATPIRDAKGMVRKWAGMNIDIHDRKKAEEALRRSEERLRVAIDAAELGTWDWNLATNEVRWNARHYAQLGLEPDPEPLTLDGFAQHLHPDDRAAVLHRLQAAVKDNQLFEAEFRILTTQNELRWMSSHGQAADIAPDGRVQRMSGVILDVTARKHTEQHLQALAASLERQVQQRTLALRESRDLLQSVYDTTLVGMAVLHAVRNEATGAIDDFIFVSVNKELARMSGRPDLVGRRYAQEFPGLVTSGIFALMVQAVETGETQQGESFYADGSFNHWLASMHVKLDGGVVSTILDITERKQAEEELLKSLRILEQSEQVAELGSWVYELATGELRWSAGMYRLFHLPPGTPVLPIIYLDYVVPADRPAAERVVRALTSNPADLEETLRLRVGNEERTLRLKAVLVRDEDGQPVRLLGVDLDMSQVQRLEADNLRLRLRQQRALFEAVQEAQEEERRRMSESLHNGLGQLLYATKLQLDCLPATLALAPGREAARLLSEAIQQTRALSHELTPAILEEFGLEATLQSVCRSLNTPALRWRCHLELDDEPLLPLSLQLAVYRLAQELAQNVLKHAHATEATLEVEMLPAWVVLRVEDNGRGFDPTRTSDGLGLRTLRSRVALLGGSVHLTTAPGQGTQCQVRIPLGTSH